MLNRVLLTIVLVFGASNASAAHRHRRAARSLLQADPASRANDDSGADPKTGADLDVAIPQPLPAIPTFVEVHSARVQNDLMLFPPTLVGLLPSGRAREPALFVSLPVKQRVRFFAPARTADELAIRRDRDKLLLFRGPQPQGAAVGIGLAMFGATTLLSAHAPRPLRIFFDGPIHLGPAVFDGGGMGAGIAGRGL